MSALLSPAELSGGMQKRVGLARAIAADPEIIFFDEPTTGLDPIMADVINDLIISTVKDVGATALSITHDMVSARARSPTSIAMLYEGKIIWAGPTAEIDHSGNPYVDQFIHGRAEGPDQDGCEGLRAVRRPRLTTLMRIDRIHGANRSEPSFRLPVLRRDPRQMVGQVRGLRRLEHHHRGRRRAAPRARSDPQSKRPAHSRWKT